MSPSFRVADIVAGVRASLERRALALWAVWVAVALAGVGLLAWLLAGSGGWGRGNPLPLLLDLLFLTLVGGGAVWLRHRAGRWFSEPSLTESIEDAANLAPGTVRGSLELGRSVPVGVSTSLAVRAERGVAGRLAGVEGDLAGDLGRTLSSWRRRGRNIFAILAPVLMVLALVWPERTVAAFRGLGTPVTHLTRPSLPPLGVRPGDVEVARGGSVEVIVTAPLRDSVTLHWESAGDIPRGVVRSVTEGRASFTIRDVRAPVDYEVLAPDGARSGPFTVTPVDPLFVGDVEVRLTFPSHTGRPDVEYRGDVPPVTLPLGTALTFDGVASRPLSEGAVVDSLGEPAVVFEVGGTAFGGRWYPRRSGVYRWFFRDVEGAEAEITPLPLDLVVVEDSVPEVSFIFPARDTVLPMNLRQPLVIQSRDDYGVDDLELVAYRVTSLGNREEPVVQHLDLGGSRAVMARPIMDLSGWGLLPGDTVRYYARVVDNHPSEQSARTPEYVLRMSSGAELRRAAEEQLDDTAERMEEIAERAVRSEEETRALERRAAAEGQERSPIGSRSDPSGEQPGFEEREDIRRALEEQMGLEAEVDSLRRELAQLAESLRETGMSDPELRKDLEELQELMREVASEEARERLEEMAEGLERQDSREAGETVDQLQEQQEAFRRQIEESIERFKRAAVEQDFRATTSEAEELAEQEKALAEAMQEGDDPEKRAAQQDELGDRAEEMDGRMERLEQRLQELGENDAAREVREAREQANQSRQSMQEAGRQARQQQSAQAGQQAAQASEEMDAAAQELRDAQQEMAEEQRKAMEQALRQAADDALTLARRQSELRDQMRSASRQRLTEMRAEVAAVEQGARNMADNLAVTTQAQGAGNRDLETRVGQAMEALARTVTSMQNVPGSPSAQSAAADAVQALNEVALLALAGANQASQGAPQQGQQSGQGEVQQQLEDVAQQQGQLNNQAGQMMPMQLGEQALRRRMEELARSQQTVADELDRIGEEPGDRSDVLGDLEELAREAQELARAMEQGRLDPETRARQERLFHRLLDAGRSLEQDETSEEREAERAGAFERGVVQPLGADALGTLRYRLPSAEVLQRMSPAERQLVVQYFERLNRERGLGGAPAPAGGSDGGSADGSSGTGPGGGR